MPFYSFIQRYLLNAYLFEPDLLLGIPRGRRSAEFSASSQANKQIVKFSAMGAITEAWTKYSEILKALTLQGRQLTTNANFNLRNVLRK